VVEDETPSSALENPSKTSICAHLIAAPTIMLNKISLAFKHLAQVCEKSLEILSQLHLSP
jgi:hypothetical protein